MSYLDIVKTQLRIDEVERSKPYRDSVGKLTIGVGRDLDDVGLREDEISLMLNNDVSVAEFACDALFPSFKTLSDNRKAVLVNMAFNLGMERLAGFRDMRKAIAKGDFDKAADAMMDSLWARQVGDRAKRLEKLMRSG